MFNKKNSNKQKCRLVTLVPFQTFRVWPFITLESMQGLHWHRNQRKRKKEKLCSSRAALPRSLSEFFRYLSHLCRSSSQCVSMGRAGGPEPPNNFDRHISFGQRPRYSRCSSVQCVYFGLIKRENYYLWLQQLKLAGN